MKHKKMKIDDNRQEKDPKPLEEPGSEQAQSTAADRPEEKKTKDCRDNCMHCGNHCIYLNQNREEK